MHRGMPRTRNFEDLVGSVYFSLECLLKSENEGASEISLLLPSLSNLKFSVYFPYFFLFFTFKISFFSFLPKWPVFLPVPVASAASFWKMGPVGWMDSNLSIWTSWWSTISIFCCYFPYLSLKVPPKSYFYLKLIFSSCFMAAALF